MKISETTLKKIIKSIGMIKEEEIGCDTCFEELDRFVDMLREGEDPAVVMPLVQHHLEVCPCCHEETEALLNALAAIDEDMS
jgi:hypothetical protein